MSLFGDAYNGYNEGGDPNVGNEPFPTPPGQGTAAGDAAAAAAAGAGGGGTGTANINATWGGPRSYAPNQQGAYHAPMGGYRSPQYRGPLTGGAYGAAPAPMTQSNAMAPQQYRGGAIGQNAGYGNWANQMANSQGRAGEGGQAGFGAGGGYGAAAAPVPGSGAPRSAPNPQSMASQALPAAAQPQQQRQALPAAAPVAQAAPPMARQAPAPTAFGMSRSMPNMSRRF